jgi:hypothetical protein
MGFGGPSKDVRILPLRIISQDVFFRADSGPCGRDWGLNEDYA